MANLNLHGDVSKNEELLHQAYNDLITFGKIFSPQDFLASETPQFHREVGKLMLDRSKSQLGLVLPRDHAKSTLAANAILHRFLFATKDKPEFVCWVGEAQDQSLDNLSWIQNHIYDNPAIHYYFGDLVGDKWTKSDFTLSNGCRMIGKGTSQRLRGKRQLIDFDKGGALWCNGTIVHWDSFLNTIVTESREAKKTGSDYSWEVYTRKAIIDGVPLWESRHPIEKLNKIKQFYIDSGTPAKFYQEYMNEARSPDDQIFTAEDINASLYSGNAKFDTSSNCWYIDLADGRKEYVSLFMGVDPASSISDIADYSVIMVIGITESNDYYVVDYMRKRTLPMDCAEEIFKMYERYKRKFMRIQIETITYQEMLRDYVMRRGKSEGLFLPVVGIKNYGNKAKKDRLFEGLQPMFKAGAVHIKKSQHELISELLDFPKGSHDDTIDAFWLSVQNTRNIKPRFSSEMGTERKKRKKYNFLTGARI